jgi:hypothetical protein
VYVDAVQNQDVANFLDHQAAQSRFLKTCGCGPDRVIRVGEVDVIYSKTKPLWLPRHNPIRMISKRP